MDVLLALVIGVLVATAVYLMLARNLIRFIFGLILISNAANLLIFLAGRLTPETPPLIAAGAYVPPAGAANPLPQALVLTAIVIGFGLFAFALTLVYRGYQSLGTLMTDEMRLAEPPEMARPAPKPAATAAAPFAAAPDPAAPAAPPDPDTPLQAAVAKTAPAGRHGSPPEPGSQADPRPGAAGSHGAAAHRPGPGADPGLGHPSPTGGSGQARPDAPRSASGGGSGDDDEAARGDVVEPAHRGSGEGRG